MGSPFDKDDDLRANLFRLLDRDRTIAGPGFNRWLIPPAALAVHLCIGEVYGFSVFNQPLTRVVGVTRSVPGEDWTIYELDPLIVDIARNRKLFRSLSMCAPNAKIVTGDGRLTLREAKPDIDLLMLDVFSSDSVPVHMLTREAFALYRSRLAPHGALVVHISNAHLKLEDVVAASAEQNGMVTVVDAEGRIPLGTIDYRAQVAVVVHSVEDLKALKLGKEWHLVAPAARPWSDDYSDIFGAMLAKWRQPG